MPKSKSVYSLHLAVSCHVEVQPGALTEASPRHTAPDPLTPEPPERKATHTSALWQGLGLQCSVTEIGTTVHPRHGIPLASFPSMLQVLCPLPTAQSLHALQSPLSDPLWGHPNKNHLSGPLSRCGNADFQASLTQGANTEP